MEQHVWTIASCKPHDFFLCLDIDSYFDYEHQPDQIFDKGFTRPISLQNRDILVTLYFNGDTESPQFTVKAHEKLNPGDQSDAEAAIRRILGCDLNIAPFYDQAVDDPVLSPLFQELYGLKRLSRASLFEEALNRIIQTQIRHKPTARKMVYDVRGAYGTRLESDGIVYPAWPRPDRLLQTDPNTLKRYGLSLRKGEYVIGLAEELLNGRIFEEFSMTKEFSTNEDQKRENYLHILNYIENMRPQELYENLLSIRGIGSTTAQDLIHFRGRTDGWFASRIDKGREQAVRRWIILSYGGDPDHCDDTEFQYMIRRWKGYEAVALEFLYVNWILSEKKKSSHG